MKPRIAGKENACGGNRANTGADLWVIPQPKYVRREDRRVRLNARWSISVKKGCHDKVRRSARLLREDFRKTLGLSLPLEETTSFRKKNCIVMGLTDDDADLRNVCRKAEREARGEIGEEGYVLEAGPRIVIVALGFPGLFYGTQTLFQMAERGGHFERGRPISLPGVRIVDWPDLQVRGVHFYPHLVDFGDAVRKLGRYKINTMVVEYGSRFPSRKHPVIADELAFNEQELKKILTLAGERYIEIVPMVECIGHTHFILTHKEYAHLREDRKHAGMLCPSNSDSLKLIKELNSEMISFHGEGKYFHIGADEARRLGTCPRCRKEAGRKGMSRLFIDYINKVAGHVKQQGRIPIMWDDMLRHHPEDLDVLDKDIIVHYWHYQAGSDRVPSVDGLMDASWMRKRYDGAEWTMDRRYLSRDIAFDWDITKAPAERKKFFVKYWKTCGYPEYTRAFPYTGFFQDRGLRVIGSPAAVCSSDGPIAADYRRAIPNITTFIKRLGEEGSLGVVTSCWGSVRQLGLYGLVCSAAYSWSGQRMSEQDFDRRFCYQYYGLEDTTMVDILYLLSGWITGSNARRYEKQVLWAQKLLKEVRPKIRKNRQDLPYLSITAKISFYETIRILLVAQDLSRGVSLKLAKQLKTMRAGIKGEIRRKKLDVDFDPHEGIINGTVSERRRRKG